jgi:hypothetical protein
MSDDNEKKALRKDKENVTLFAKPLKVINVGLPVFHESLSSQGADVVQVAWQPPAAGDLKLTQLLDKLL